MNRLHTILCAACVLLIPTTLWADPIFSNAIESSSPATSSPYTIGQFTAANISATGIGRTGLDANNAANQYRATGWEESNTIDPANKFFSLQLAADTGFAIDFENLIYVSDATGSGPNQFAIRSSIDGFAANIATPDESGGTIDLTGAQFQGVSGDVEFRIYGVGANNSSGQFGVHEFTFNGAVSAVPEPAAVSSLLLLCGTVAFRRRR